jgi:large subunit ribosomal protein L9
MPMHLQVILQSDVDKLGKSGELVRVRPGYARNFLIPRSLGVPASESAVNRLNHEKAVALAKYEKQKKEAGETAKKIGELSIRVLRAVGEDGKLFGAVTTKEIEAAAKALGLDIDRKRMSLAEPIKALGVFEIPVKLMPEVTATLKVEVAKK